MATDGSRSRRFAERAQLARILPHLRFHRAATAVLLGSLVLVLVATQLAQAERARADRKELEHFAEQWAVTIEALSLQIDSAVRAGSAVAEATGGNVAVFERTLSQYIEGNPLQPLHQASLLRRSETTVDVLGSVGGQPQTLGVNGGLEGVTPISAVGAVDEFVVVGLRTVGPLRYVGAAYAQSTESEYVAYTELRFPTDPQLLLAATALSRTGGPGDQFEFDTHLALYLGGSEAAPSLVASTAPELPIVGTRETRSLRLGSVGVLMVVGSEARLAGGMAAYLPRAILILGPVIALALAHTTEQYSRRRERDRRLAADAERQTASEAERHRFEAMADSMEAGLLMIDAEDRVTYCNSRFGSLVGIDAASIVGRKHDELRLKARARMADEDSVSKFSDAYEAVRSGGGAAHRTVELQVVHPEERTLQVTVFAIRDRQRNYLGQGHLVRDATREAAIDRMKSEFVAVASHELRTPLTGIYGFSKLLAEVGEWDDDANEWAHHIYQEAGRLTTIIDDLLNVSRIESGGLVVASELIDLDEAVSQAVESFAGASERHTVRRVRSDSGSDWPSGLAASGDRAKLVQVLSNLVDNAIKYSPEGGEVGLSYSASGDAVSVSVHDEGVGISEGDQERVFGRFERIDHPEMRSIRSTGLGLYVVRELVSRMGGDVRVESKVGEGSTFTVTLPLAEAQETAA